MGCSTSRIDQLPAVSLCHDRCKFLEEALYQSYALADAHVAYMQSLKSLGPTLHRFFDQTLIVSDDSQSKENHNPCSSPDKHPSSSTNSDSSHIYFPSDSEDDEEDIRDKDFDLLHRIHPNYFNRRTPTPNDRFNSYSDYNDDNNNKEYDYRSWTTPPPPAPSSSAWDFLNFFEIYEGYEMPAKDKDFENELRLEDKAGKNGDKNRSGVKLKAENANVKQSVVHVVEKKVQSEKKKDNNSDSTKDSPQRKNRSVSEAMKEVEVLFDRAAESGNEVLKMLDAGKFRYYHKNSVYQGVSSNMLHTITPSLFDKNGSFHVGFDENLGIVLVNLSSALRKLCLWEKKLYDEVKVEEKLCIIHAKNCRLMNNFGEKGADANKVKSTQTLLRMLSTKIKVSIQVIDKISITINRLRDEELWPLICDLIRKLLGMWKAMVECHGRQFQAVAEARSLDAITSNVMFSDAYLEAAIKLKIELQHWNLSFSNWIASQRGYVKALNGWLLKCLPCEPEEMPNDEPPFSSERIGAPPVFMFCNKWSHAIDKVSEMEVSCAMNGFFAIVNQFLDQHYVYVQQKLRSDKEMEKKMKVLEREEQRLHKVILARGKKMSPAGRDTDFSRSSGQAVHQSEMTNSISLQLGLKKVFVAIEGFSADSLCAYEQLHVYTENVRLSRKNPEAP